MSKAIIALTRKGKELAVKIGRGIGADIYCRSVNENTNDSTTENTNGNGNLNKDANENRNDYENGNENKNENGNNGLSINTISDFRSTVEKLFQCYSSLIFVMACGIVVRSISPYLKNKQEDPAVVVVDEQGRFAISLVSGHIGGGNRLARHIAEIIGGVPVITTSTDVNGMIAFDEFAVENNCAIENIGNLKCVSSELVNGGTVYLYSDCRIKGDLPENIRLVEINNHIAPGGNGKFNFDTDTNGNGKYGINAQSDGTEKQRVAVALTNSLKPRVKADKILYIRPRNLILGIGCRKGRTKDEIEQAVSDFLEANNKSILSVRCVASISLKAAEKGILDFCRERNIAFKTFTAEEIKTVEDRFSCSEFVKMKTGAGNVAETCTILAGGVTAGAGGTRLVAGKTVYRGITLALAEEETILAI